MLITKSTCEYRQRIKARAGIIGKLKTSAKDNKVVKILIILIKIRDNRRAYTINIEIIS
jgi:hypothetical protein